MRPDRQLSHAEGIDLLRQLEIERSHAFLATFRRLERPADADDMHGIDRRSDLLAQRERLTDDGDPLDFIILRWACAEWILGGLL